MKAVFLTVVLMLGYIVLWIVMTTRPPVGRLCHVVIVC